MISIFDDLNGKFDGRLREIASTTRNTADGKATITFKTGRVEAAYSPEVVKKLEAGRLLAIPNVLSVGSNDTFSIYEIADVYPLHYSMLTLDRSQPGAIRTEFMSLIEEEWKKGSKSTWIEIVSAPTGYIMRLSGHNVEFVRKNVSPLAGSRVNLLSKEAVQKFICYTPKDTKQVEQLTIGHLLGVTEEKIPFTVHMEKLLHYHVGVFAFTGSGKSNLTSLMIRKAVATVDDLKVVIFDISSEYGISLIDCLDNYASRIIFTEIIPEEDEMVEEYYKRHVVPEALQDKKEQILRLIAKLVKDDKIREMSVASESEQAVRRFTSYTGLLDSLTDIVNDRYAGGQQKMIVPSLIGIVKEFMRANKLEEDSVIDEKARPLLSRINGVIADLNLRAGSTLLTLFKSLSVAIENPVVEKDGKYNVKNLVNEIVDENSAKLFVINLTEADIARYFCSDIINRVFKARKGTFSLKPRILFVFDEAQEFIPQDRKKDDYTEMSSKTVERLLRHGRKYHLHGWVSTQRIAHLNTNALQQLHSYFVSTMPRPYDRQLISDTFAIDDAFMDRTLTFQNGDWLMTSFKATNTQNVPVFLHAFNNEEFIIR
ncbi:MAG: ATP-binding protein [Nitrososphaerales archaeon]